MSRGNDDSADQDAAVLPETDIRNQAAEDGGKPDAAGIHPIDSSRLSVRESETTCRGRRRHIKDEKRAHSVVAETLPHLREKERAEAARVTDFFRHCREVTTQTY